MREGWKEIEFNKLFKINLKNGIYKSAEFQGKGISIVNMKELFGYEFIGDQKMKLVELTENEEGFLLKNGDLLFARRSIVESGAGKVSIIKDLTQKLTFESSIIRVRLNHQICNPLFYYYYFKSEFGRAILSSLSSGTNVKGIKGSDLKQQKVTFPPLPTQRKIAQILSAYDDLIENNLRRIALLEEQAQLTYEEWFVRLRFPGFEEVEIVEGLPVGWEKVELGEEVEISSSKRIFFADYVDKGIPFYRSKEIILKSKNIALDDILFISKDRFENIKKKYGIPQRGDILITAVGTLGFPYLVTESDGDFYFKDGNLIWLKNSTSISSEYLISIFKNPQFKMMLNNIAIGSSQKALTIKSVKKIEILKPTKEILKKFDKKIISILNAVENLQNQNRLLQEARDILLPRLMLGVVDVEEVSGQVVEEVVKD